MNDEDVDNANNLDIAMSMHNLIEYSDNYSGTSGSLWQFKRDESSLRDTGNLDNISTANLTSFKYKSSFFKPLTPDDNGISKDVKIAIPLKYLSNFWRSLELPLINCKIHLESNWSKDFVMSNVARAIKFKTANTKLYVPIVTLSSKDNVKLLLTIILLMMIMVQLTTLTKES